MAAGLFLRMTNVLSSFQTNPLPVARSTRPSKRSFQLRASRPDAELSLSTTTLVRSTGTSEDSNLEALTS